MRYATADWIEVLMAATRRTDGGKKTAGAALQTRSGKTWKLEDAKARFSEVVRLARSEPQWVTVRGKDAVVVMSVEALERLIPVRPAKPLLAFLEGLALGGLDLDREPDRGRDAA